jgi:DNA-directed RNA polymerase subunit RPC12/RpoP
LTRGKTLRRFDWLQESESYTLAHTVANSIERFCMEMIFTCPNCKQQLEAETVMAGSEIECPSCNERMVVPEPTPSNIKTSSHHGSAAARQEYHFAVPIHEEPPEVLIEKPKPPLSAATKDGEKTLRLKCIRRTDCVEVGRDRFDEVVSEFLNKIGEPNIVSITPLTYTHIDLGTRQLLTDFGVMLVYKG